MKTTEFRKNYELDVKARNLRARAKNPADELPEILTADGTIYDAAQGYYFFDISTREVRSSVGLRRTGEHLCAFGLKVVTVADLHSNRDGALTAGQSFFKSEIERLQKRIADYELEKSPASRSLKAYLMAKE